MMFEEVNKILNFATEKGIYPDIPIIESSPTEPEVIVDGKKVLMFSSNNYLGLANHPGVKEAVLRGVEKYGMGSGGSRLMSGNTDVQIELEERIAKFKGCESAITFVTGYMANTGTIQALLNPPNVNILDILKKYNLLSALKDKSVVFSDELNHASIVDGCRLGKAERIVYKHRDVADLENKLKKAKKYKRKLIITDGVFSMDGDVAPIKEIMDLADEYGAVFMVDDAHSTGVLGENGRGTAEFFKLEKNPDITMGTFTKAFGGIGGFIAGSKEMIDYLRVMARTYMFTAPIPPAIVTGLIESINIIENDKDRIKRVWENSRYLKNKLSDLGFNVLDSESPIVPVLVGEDKKGIELSRAMLEKGFFAPCVRWPAVPAKKSRLRLTVMSEHSKEQIDSLINALVEIRSKIQF